MGLGQCDHEAGSKCVECRTCKHALGKPQLLTLQREAAQKLLSGKLSDDVNELFGIPDEASFIIVGIF